MNPGPFFGAVPLSLSPQPRARLKILFVGDLHLGVLPGHLPAESRLDAHSLSPAAAWQRVVAAARKHAVHAVALAGDLVDGRNDLFEAFGPLEEGLRSLDVAGIPVVAVAGNHDTRVLPRLAEMLDGLHLLGPGGTWSSFIVSGPAGLEARLTGWSFPRAHVETSPLTTPPPAADPRRPTLGLLHADLDQTASRYAPVSTAELQRTGYRAWFLGHTHRPDTPNTDGRPFYLGSVVGLHPGETGEHGPVLVEMDGAGRLEARRLPLAPLRWEQLDVAVDREFDPAYEEFLPQLLEAVRQRGAELGPALDETLAVGFRLRLKGETQAAPRVRGNLARLETDEPSLVLDQGRTVLFIDRIEADLALPLDLADLARFPDPAGLLARRLLILAGQDGNVPGCDNPAAERERLLLAAEEKLAAVDALGAFRGLGEAPAREDVRQHLLAAGQRALEEILIHREAPHAAG